MHIDVVVRVVNNQPRAKVAKAQMWTGLSAGVVFHDLHFSFADRARLFASPKYRLCAGGGANRRVGIINATSFGGCVTALALAWETRRRLREGGRTRVGTLTCNISPGVGLIVAGQRQLSCIYASARGRAREAYEGTVSTLGLDIGATSGGQTDLGRFCADHTAPGGVDGNLCGCDRRPHGRRRSGCQRPGRRLGPHGRLAACIRAGADGLNIAAGVSRMGAAAGHSARTSHGPVMTPSLMN